MGLAVVPRTWISMEGDSAIELIRETRTQTQPSAVSSISQKKSWYLSLKGLPPEFWNPKQFLGDDLQSCSLSLKVQI